MAFLEKRKKNKPYVAFTRVDGSIDIGSPATLWPVDHPSSKVSNNGPVKTSPVESVSGDKNGITEIETQNTFYYMVGR